MERFVTSNALDSSLLALRDSGVRLRGTLAETVSHDLGQTGISAGVEALRFDTYDFEDDTTVTLSVRNDWRPSETLELRTTLSWRRVDEGDDFALGDFVIPIRTVRNRLSGQLEAGLRIDAQTILALEAAALADRPGDTVFDLAPRERIRLDPDRELYRLGARLSRGDEAFAVGLSTALDIVQARPSPEGTPAFPLSVLTARTEMALRGGDGSQLALAAGIQKLAAEGGLLSELRPTFEIGFEFPLTQALALRGTLSSAYDWVDSDDPLASRLGRLELEARYGASPTLDLSAGLFEERRDNLLLGNRDHARGLFALASWRMREGLELYARVEHVAHTATILEIGRRRTEAAIGLRVGL